MTTRVPASRRSSSARSSAASQRDRLEPELPALQRLGDAVLGREMRVRETALVAQPAAVDLGMVARENPLDLALAHGRVDVAAHRAEPADGRNVLDVPRPRLEAVLRRGERTDRAELDHVARERRPVGVALERGDLGVGATVPRDELVVLGHVGGEPRAAVTEDAALAVERDQRRDRESASRA